MQPYRIKQMQLGQPKLLPFSRYFLVLFIHNGLTVRRNSLGTDHPFRFIVTSCSASYKSSIHRSRFLGNFSKNSRLRHRWAKSQICPGMKCQLDRAINDMLLRIEFLAIKLTG